MICLLWVVLGHPLLAQNAEREQTAFLPDDWSGVWTGTMDLYQGQTLTDTVPVRMTIARLPEKDRVWTWKTEYISDKYPITKDYVLLLEDPESNKYTLDEGDGILLYEYQWGEKLYSAFEVQGNHLVSTYEMVGEHLVFEITSGKKMEGETEGVTSFSVLNLQRVVLTREK